MERLYRRPAALFCIAAVYAGFAGVLVRARVRWVFAILCALALTAALFLRPPHIFTAFRRTGAILFAGLLSGTLFFSLYTDVYLSSPIRTLAGETVPITGIVERCDSATSYSATYTVQLQAVQGKRATYRILLTTPNTALTAGDVIETTAEFSAFSSGGSFDEERYYFSRAVRLRAESNSVEITGTASLGVRGAVESLRSALCARFRYALGRDDAALPAALFLGERTLLSDSLTRDFRRLGISHLLAISGLHFTLLFGALENLLTAWIPMRRVRRGILSCLTVLYMLLAGLSESVVRAGVMLLFSYLADAVAKQRDTPTSLGVSAALICVCSPSSFYSVGFQLSVTAVLALCVLDHVQRIPREKARNPHVPPKLRAAGASLLTSAGVQLMMLPLLCVYFGEASLLTPLATLLFSLPVQILLILSPILLLLPNFTPLLAAVSLICRLTEWAATQLSVLPGITVSLRYVLCPFFACALAGTLFSLSLTRTRRQLHRALGICGVLVIACAAYIAGASAAFHSTDTVISVQYHENDALILASDGAYLLCDISDGSYTALRTACETAREHYATEIEGLLLTHLHKRHIQSTARLAQTYILRSLILPTPETADEAEIAVSIASFATENKIPVVYYDARAADCILFGSTEIYPGERVYLSRSTHPVITLTVKTPEFSVQYLGKSWNETTVCTEGDVLLLGAHGPIYKRTFTLPQTGTILLRPAAAEFYTGEAAARLYETTEPLILRTQKSHTGSPLPETEE